MKDFYVRDAAEHENKTITSNFVVVSKQIKPKKTGELYLWLTLADKTGHLEARMWDNVAECLYGFEQNDFVKVKGLINKYNGRFQLTIHKLRKMEESEVEFGDYLPRTTKDVEQLWQQLAGFVASFKNPYLKALLEAFMGDAEIATAYKNAPAAKTLHHAFIGGLLDHVVSLATSCDLVCRNYPQIDRDLLLTGAFLHDIGKIHELNYQRALGYTTRGQLLGHMIIELEMLQEKIDEVNKKAKEVATGLAAPFPPELKTLLEHLIISHHGQYDFGSPKLPMFPEALMLHYLDDLDSKMESMRAHFEREAESESEWTSYNSSLARPLLNTQKFLNKKQAAVEKADAEAEPKAAAAASDGTPSGK